MRFKIINEEWCTHKARIISHYFVRGVDPSEWKQRLRDRDLKGGSEVRRGGLDIYYVIEERDKKDVMFEVDRKSKMQIMRVDIGIWTKKKLVQIPKD